MLVNSSALSTYSFKVTQQSTSQCRQIVFYTLTVSHCLANSSGELENIAVSQRVHSVEPHWSLRDYNC